MDWKTQAISTAAMLAWEAWLGKTNKVQAGSTLELVANGAMALGSALFTKKEDPKPEEKSGT